MNYFWSQYLNPTFPLVGSYPSLSPQRQPPPVPTWMLHIIKKATVWPSRSQLTKFHKLYLNSPDRQRYPKVTFCVPCIPRATRPLELKKSEFLRHLTMVRKKMGRAAWHIGSLSPKKDSTQISHLVRAACRRGRGWYKDGSVTSGTTSWPGLLSYTYSQPVLRPKSHARTPKDKLGLSKPLCGHLDKFYFSTFDYLAFLTGQL